MTARYWLTTILAAASALVLTVATDHAQAEDAVVGAHLHTVHFDSDKDKPPGFETRDSTPGIYIRTSSGLTAGLVRNSLGRPSAYLAQTWATDNERWALTLGAMTGYKHKIIRGQHVCRDGYTDAPESRCEFKHGETNALLRPLIAPSWSWIEARQYIGATPRVALLGKGVHLSVEAAWK